MKGGKRRLGLGRSGGCAFLQIQSVEKQHRKDGRKGRRKAEGLMWGCGSRQMVQDGDSDVRPPHWTLRPAGLGAGVGRWGFSPPGLAAGWTC